MIRKIKNIIHFCSSFAACVWYGFPSRGMTVIGVTGTDGKTTTVSMIYHLLSQSGFKTAVISTMGAEIDGKTSDIGFHVTTPSAFVLQRYIKTAKQKGVTHLVLEITSHGLDQHRDFGIHFDIGVLTNVTHEHLDYHKTYDNYVKTKLKLIKKAKVGIINKDDRSYEFIKSKNQELRTKIVSYGFFNADVTIKDFPVEKIFNEKFNSYNALAAASVGKILKIDQTAIMNAFKSASLPRGRQEIVYDKYFTVMIDFAHTPNAFQVLLQELAKKKKKRLIHVFGCASERDIKKRPEMGKISSEFCDVIILTAEDPRRENINKINKEIKSEISNFQFLNLNEYNNSHVTKNKKYLFEIPDRKDAISFAVSIAQKNDYIVITGKAHEKSMNIGGVEHPWDEFKTVHDALQKYHYEK